MTEVVLGLGSNSGDRLVFLRQGVRALRALDPDRLRVLRVSPIYESQAMLPEGAASSWNQPFLNLCVLCKTDFEPEALLAYLKSVENRLGRKQRERWSLREIDLDVLAIQGGVWKTPALEVPHPGLLERPFALLPFADLTSEWEIPGTGRSAGELAGVWRGSPSSIPFETQRTGYFLSELVGVLNVTPDSFSDGGKFLAPERAFEQAQELVRSGATVLDIGAESTRPQAQTVSPETEWERLAPVLERVRGTSVISADTRNPSSATRAIELGANWINDVSGCESPEMRAILAASQVDVVVMHNLGVPPQPGRVLSNSEDPLAAVLKWGREALSSLEASGIARSRVIFDPGLGFGKTPEQNFHLLRNVYRFHELGVRVLVGHSRKSMIAKLNSHVSAGERDLESAILSESLARQGVDYLRVHDVALNQRVLRAAAWAE